MLKDIEIECRHRHDALTFQWLRRWSRKLFFLLKFSYWTSSFIEHVTIFFSIQFISLLYIENWQTIFISAAPNKYALYNLMRCYESSWMYWKVVVFDKWNTFMRRFFQTYFKSSFVFIHLLFWFQLNDKVSYSHNFRRISESCTFATIRCLVNCLGLHMNV